MTLESILYLLFGFLIAVFLALILIPVIWNRAVFLTERKVKSSLPYNTREIEAEKGALRAEHAMTIRRLELAIDELRDKASGHIAELHSKRDENNRLKSTGKVAQESLANLERAAEQMRGKIADMHEEKTTLSDELKKTTEKFVKLKSEHDDLLTRHSNDGEELSRSRIDLIAKEGKIESLTATLESFNLSDDAKATKIKQLSEEVTNLKNRVEEERKQSKKLQQSSQALAKQLTKASDEIETSDKETSEELETTRRELENRILDLGEALMQERTRSIELEAELARQALNVEISNSEARSDNSVSNLSRLEEIREMSEKVNEEVKELANKKLTNKQREELRASIRSIGEKTSRIASV